MSMTETTNGAKTPTATTYRNTITPAAPKKEKSFQQSDHQQEWRRLRNTPYVNYDAVTADWVNNMSPEKNSKPDAKRRLDYPLSAHDVATKAPKKKVLLWKDTRIEPPLNTLQLNNKYSTLRKFGNGVNKSIQTRRPGLRK